MSKQTGVIWEPQYDGNTPTLHMRIKSLLRQLDIWERRARDYEDAISQVCDTPTLIEIYRHMEKSEALNKEGN